VFAYSIEEKSDADKRLSQANLWPRLDDLLQDITVVDPACGSGSFLIGMLQVIDDLSQRADAVIGRQETSYERRKRIIGQSLYGVDVMRWAVEVAELRLWLQLVIETELEPAELKFRPCCRICLSR
jgi:type II restriction/modification system DNA methylase subunit YeeA